MWYLSHEFTNGIGHEKSLYARTSGSPVKNAFVVHYGLAEKF